MNDGQTVTQLVDAVVKGKLQYDLLSFLIFVGIAVIFIAVKAILRIIEEKKEEKRFVEMVSKGEDYHADWRKRHL